MANLLTQKAVDLLTLQALINAEGLKNAEGSNKAEGSYREGITE